MLLLISESCNISLCCVNFTTSAYSLQEYELTVRSYVIKTDGVAVSVYVWRDKWCRCVCVCVCGAPLSAETRLHPLSPFFFRMEFNWKSRDSNQGNPRTLDRLNF
jgi:hypothetical protein